MIDAGIDIGSRTIKLVLLKDKHIIESRMLENTFDILKNCREILKGISYDRITATGYGRHFFSEYFGSEVISEIKAFAIGTHFFYPACRTILDIGGQDTKAISLNEQGKMLKFDMNDKCAAGTGKFLEIMAMSLRYTLNEFGGNALKAGRIEKINSMCTVFAESEVVSTLAKGAKREEVARGIMQSVVLRSSTQLKRVGLKNDLVFVGGVAKNIAIQKLLEKEVGMEVVVPENPQIIGALGAALFNEKLNLKSNIVNH